MSRFEDQASPYTKENQARGNVLTDLEKDRIQYGNVSSPWEGLGADVSDKKSVKAIMKTAGLLWEVEKHQLSDQFGPVDKFALRRKDNDVYLDTVGKAYKPAQNEPAFEMFEKFLEKGKSKMSVAGLIGGGRYVWALADLGKSFELKGNDTVNGYLLIAVPHMQGRSLVMKYTNIRGLCNNILSGALMSKTKGGKSGEVLGTFKHGHRMAFDAAAFKKAELILGVARDQHAEFGETAAKLQKKRMGADDIYDVLQPVFAPDLDADDIKARKITPRMKQLLEINEMAPGAQPNNAWGVLNAVTYYTTHVQGKTQDRRLQQMWVGKAGNLVEKVQRALVAA